MATTIPNWVPKYIQQTVNYRAGTKPTPERFNELFNLLIVQGDYNTQTMQTLLANLDGFDIDFSAIQHDNTAFQTAITQALNSSVATLRSEFAQADNNLSAQLTQAVQLMLTDYVTEANVSSLFEQEADSITARIVANIGDKMVTSATLQAELEITATSIIQQVSTTLQSYSTTQQMSAAIELRAGSITQTVDEQINGISQSLSQTTQTANMIHWLVKDGDSASTFTVTDRLASLISPNIDLTGYVTFHALGDPSDITVINGGTLQSMSGSLAGFTFSDDPITGGFQYYNAVAKRFMRMNPYTTWDGLGGYNYNYGSIDCGISDDGMNTLVHLRSDGYARFGLVSENGISVRFNDFLRLQQGVAGATDTILYSKNFSIGRDGNVIVKAENIPKAITAFSVVGNTVTIDTEDGPVVYDMTTDTNGVLTAITVGGTTIPISFAE